MGRAGGKAAAQTRARQCEQREVLAVWRAEDRAANIPEEDVRVIEANEHLTPADDVELPDA